jgi:7,8-dihydropterin-6-yl-methyl-4-(beta-D-ribofuranosyl)aminobenzene 5'-phosphate synthase
MAGLQPVDRIEIQVLVDNSTDSVSSAPAGVTLEWPMLMRAGMHQLSGDCQCCANHGLALVVTVWRGGERRSVLFDAGPVGFAVEYNGKRLGIDFGRIEAVVLSHGHWDHAGGLPTALGLISKANGGRRVAAYLHPGMFRQRGWPLPGGAVLPIEPIPSLEQLATAGAETICTTEPQDILDAMFHVSGEIPRVTPYERGFPGHVRRSADGTAWEPDPLIMDERFLLAHVRDKGLVVFTACSHAGVVNVLTHARASFPGVPLYGVTGGFHLAGGNERIIAQSVRDIGSFGLSLVAPGHCTGWRAVNALATAFGDKLVVPSAVGKMFAI